MWFNCGKNYSFLHCKAYFHGLVHDFAVFLVILYLFPIVDVIIKKIFLFYSMLFCPQINWQFKFALLLIY